MTMPFENGPSTNQLISGIKETEWIDLSDRHKELREDLQNRVCNACVKKRGVSPIMVKGAFGIGKTAILHYLFHYGWTRLAIPVFQADLGDIITVLKKHNAETGLEKTPNEDVGHAIRTYLDGQVDLLKSKGPEQINGRDLFFPGFKNDTLPLADYLEGFRPATVYSIRTSSGSDHELSEENLPLFDWDTIQAALKNGGKYLLLIDEFEAKFHELKEIVSASGGGILRDFFDYVTESTSGLYCIIANGPTSGYELSRDSEIRTPGTSDAADQRRIIVKQIFTPNSKMLAKSFLWKYDRRHINFYWWVSRSRPGQIKQLKDSLEPFESLLADNYIEFIKKNDVLKNQIDDMGESNVPLIKTDLISNLDSHDMQVKMKDLLISIGPHRMDVSEDKWKKRFITNKKLFFFSKDLVNKDKDVIEAILLQDISRILNEKGIDTDKDLLHNYLDLIFGAMTDENGQMAFGTLKEGGGFDETVSEIMSSILKLVDDFISIYEDETDLRVKGLLDFIRELLNALERNKDSFELFPKTVELIENNSVRINSEEELYLQLSVTSIQEIIEQPIGSPKLGYQNESMEAAVLGITEVETLLAFREADNEIVFIPDFSDKGLLQSYLETLSEYLSANWDKGRQYRKDGNTVATFLYISPNEHIDAFKKKWQISDDMRDQPLPWMVGKMACVPISDFQLTNAQRVAEFIDSICTTGVVGAHKQEIDVSSEDHVLDIRQIIKKINDPSWTSSKQIRRTISYYRDLLLNGENSALNQIVRNGSARYRDRVKTILNGTSDFKAFSEAIPIDDIDHFTIMVPGGKAAKNTISLFLAERIPDGQAMDPEIPQIVKHAYFTLDESDEGEVSEISLQSCNRFFSSLNQQLPDMMNEFCGSPSDTRAFHTYVTLLAGHMTIDDLDSIMAKLQAEDPGFDRYFYHLGYRRGKTYYLHGVFFQALLNRLDLATEARILQDSLKEKESNLARLISDLTEICEDVKQLAGIESDILERRALMDYRAKVLVPAICHLDAPKYWSDVILFHSIARQGNRLIEKTEAFTAQMETLRDLLTEYKEKVDEKQNHVNDVYENGDTLAKGLYDAQIPIAKNKHFFYNTIFRPSFKKRGEAFKRIFEKNYTPSRIFAIDDELIDQFKETLDNCYTSKEEDMDARIEKLDDIAAQVDAVEQIESMIEKLIQPDPSLLINQEQDDI
jgi:hypothetical protein